MIDRINPSDIEGASRCALAAVQKVHFSSGLSGNDALFELKNCALSAAHRAVALAEAAAGMLKEAKDTAAAQPAIEKAYRARVNEARIVYVCGSQ